MKRIVFILVVSIVARCCPDDARAAAGDGLPANPMASEDVHKLVKWFSTLTDRDENRFILANDIWSYDEGHLDTGFDRFVKSIHDRTGNWLPMIHVSYGDPTDPNPKFPGTPQQANKHAIAYWNAGGLVHIHINPNNPWTGDPYNGPNGLQHRERIAELLQPGTAAHAAWMKKLDAYAALLAELRDAGVVVLWRPLHEMNFVKCYWYDAGATPDRWVFQDLWRHLFRYFTYEKKLDNLIWVFSAAGTASWNGPDPQSMYPGADYVDVVGYSQYADEVKIWPRDLAQFAAMNKPFAFSEFGPGKLRGGEAGKFDNLDLIRAVREKYPQAIMATYWHSWTGADMSIADCRNVEALMNDPWVIDRDELDWCDTKVDLETSRRRRLNHKAFEFGLRVLPAGDPIMGCPSYSPGRTATPWLIVNPTGRELVTEDANVGSEVRLGAGEVAVHPDITEPVTIVWRSPITGIVSVEARVLDINAGVNQQFPARSDGVVAEIRQDRQTLARADIPNGGTEAKLAAPDIRVKKGDLLRLVILSHTCHWFDETRVSITVTGAHGRQWDLEDAFRKGAGIGNDRPARARDAVWWACAGDGRDLDLRLLGESNQ